MTARFGFQVTVHDKTIWLFPEDVDAALAAAKQKVDETASAVEKKAQAGIAYSWTRGPGDEPIELGSFDDLASFIDNKIIGALPEAMKPAFSVTDTFDGLVNGLPDPINGALNSLKSDAIFEIDGLRLKVPGKGSEESLQFELAMTIVLTALGLKLGPFQLNRLYAKLGNFS